MWTRSSLPFGTTTIDPTPTTFNQPPPPVVNTPLPPLPGSGNSSRLRLRIHPLLSRRWTRGAWTPTLSAPRATPIPPPMPTRMLPAVPAPPMPTPMPTMMPAATAPMPHRCQRRPLQRRREAVFCHCHRDRGGDVCDNGVVVVGGGGSSGVLAVTKSDPKGTKKGPRPPKAPPPAHLLGGDPAPVPKGPPLSRVRHS